MSSMVIEVLQIPVNQIRTIQVSSRRYCSMESVAPSRSRFLIDAQFCENVYRGVSFGMPSIFSCHGSLADGLTLT